jgi:hypothetical protein
VRLLGTLLAIGLVSAVPAPAFACTFPLPPPLAGESQESWNRRQDQFIRQWAEDGSRMWQADLFEQAARISLAKVVARRGHGGPTIVSVRQEPNDLPKIFEADVLPVASLKGELPSGTVTVKWRQELQCRFFEPGSAARSQVGTMVLLFDGFVRDVFEEPEGFPVSMVRDPRLVEALGRIPNKLKDGAK